MSLLGQLSDAYEAALMAAYGRYYDPIHKAWIGLALLLFGVAAASHDLFALATGLLTVVVSVWVAYKAERRWSA